MFAYAWQSTDWLKSDFFVSHVKYYMFLISAIMFRSYDLYRSKSKVIQDKEADDYDNKSKCAGSVPVPWVKTG